MIENNDIVVSFDFDGTLVDSIDAVVLAANTVAKDFGLKKRLTRQELRVNSITKVARSLGVPFWKVLSFPPLIGSKQS